MPTFEHEALAEMIRTRPETAVQFLDDLTGVDMPDYQEACEGSSDLSELTPTEYHADAVVVLKVDQVPVLAVVVEVQRSRAYQKRWTWPAYLATLRRRLECPSVLLVISPDHGVARWCGQPIWMGHPGWELTPIVLGPAEVPVVKDPAEASEEPAVAILSAVMHATDVAGDPVIGALGEALTQMAESGHPGYVDVAFCALPQKIRENLEAIMGFENYEYKSEFAREFIAKGKAEGIAEGKAEGKAESVLTLLRARGISVSERATACITGCSDLERLDAWMARALSVDSVDELFT